MYTLILEKLEENNKILKEIRDILREITSKEHIEKEDIKALAINLLADLMVEYKSDELRNMVNNIKL